MFTCCAYSTSVLVIECKLSDDVLLYGPIPNRGAHKHYHHHVSACRDQNVSKFPQITLIFIQMRYMRCVCPLYVHYICCLLFYYCYNTFYIVCTWSLIAHALTYSHSVQSPGTCRQAAIVLNVLVIVPHTPSNKYKKNWYDTYLSYVPFSTLTNILLVSYYTFKYRH